MRGSIRVFCLLATFFCLVASVHATTITVSDGITEILVGSQIFRVDVESGGTLTGNTTWQGPTSFSADYSFTLSGYALPAGSTIDSATLDLSAISLLPTPAIVAGTPSTGPGAKFDTSYQPILGSIGTGIYTTITAGSSTATVNLGSSSLDLLALGFGSELLSGAPITINWQQSLDLTASTANWITDASKWNKSYRDYTYSVSQAATPSGLLTITFDEATGVPEPATFGLMALGGILMLVWKRRTV